MAEITLNKLETLRQSLLDPTKDLKINLENVLKSDTLSAVQVWGVAIAASYYVGEKQLSDAVVDDAKAAGVGDEVVDDAQAAAALMGMNTIFYRFRDLVGKESYGKKQARLRMQYMARPKTSKADYELMSLGIAALAGCPMCVQAHEKGILDNGLSEDHVHDCVRIAAVLQGFAIALRVAAQ